MQLKLITYITLFTCLVYPLRGKPLPRRGCYECEEEVWEEVPCKSVPSTPAPSVTSSTSEPTRPTTQPAPTTPAPYSPTTSLPPTTASSTTSPEYTTPKDPYKKCYCECKLGCKEFCRKVAVSPSEKKIVQVSKITEPVERGRIESTHILQRTLIPKSEKTCNDNENYAPPVIDDTIVEDLTTLKPLPVPDESSCEEEAENEPEVYKPYYKKPSYPSKNYHKKPVAPIDPIYGPYAITEASVNSNIPRFEPYLNRPQYPTYFYAPNSNDVYDFPVPFEHVFSKVTKTVQHPGKSITFSLNGGSSGNIAKPLAPPYSGPPPVINSPSEENASLDQYDDDSFDSILQNVVSNDSSNEAAYPQYANPSYSVYKK